MGCAHHGRLVDGSVLIAPFFKLEPATLHIDIVHAADDRQT